MSMNGKHKLLRLLWQGALLQLPALTPSLQCLKAQKDPFYILG